MEFKGPYLRAMVERAPKMFRQMREAGTLHAHLQAKAEEAKRMLDDLTADAPKLANGLPREPHLSQAEQLVRETLIEFPTD